MKMKQREPTEETRSLINHRINYLVSILDHPPKIDDDDLIQAIKEMAMTGSAAVSVFLLA